MLAPGAVESTSLLTARCPLVVDLGLECEPPMPVDFDAACRVAGQLACPTLAFGRGGPGAEDLLARFDVHVAEAAELQAVLDTIARRPLASLALVQLLRHSEGQSIHEGLIAESLVYSVLQSGPEFGQWLHEWKERGERPPRPRDRAGPAVLALRSDEILHLTLNRPQVHNAFSSEMRDALAEGLTVALADPSIERIVLDGAGPSFCSGGDLDEFGSFPDPATAHAVRSTRNPARLLSQCADRVRSVVHGACIGAGAELPAFTAHVSASPDSFFELPEIGMGLVPGAGGTVSLPRRIGRQRTAWLALSAERIDAATACDWGLVDEVSELRS